MGIDVVVIGAGPAGSTVARIAASKGYRVLVLEKEKSIGTSPCAGYISRTINWDFDLREIVQSNISRMRTYLPSGRFQDFLINGVVVDRPAFDNFLAGLASRNGAEFLLNAPLTHLIEGEDQYTGVKYRDGRAQAGVIVGADGVSSTTARLLGYLPHEVAVCAQYLLENVPTIPHTSEIFFDMRYAPGGYAWIYPAGDNSAKVGLGILRKIASRPASEYLDEFIRKNPLVQRRLSKSIKKTIVRGALPISGMRKSLIIKNVLLVGDSGGMADPITGAGIGNAVLAGEIAGRVISRALEKEDFSLLREYETRCRRLFLALTRGKSKREELNTYRTNEELERNLPKLWVGFKKGGCCKLMTP